MSALVVALVALACDGCNVAELAEHFHLPERDVALMLKAYA